MRLERIQDAGTRKICPPGFFDPGARIDRFCSTSSLFAVASALKFYRLEPFIVDVRGHTGGFDRERRTPQGRENATTLSGTAKNAAL
jgi:hypothetical protein